MVNSFQPLTIITKRSILDVAAVQDWPLLRKFEKMKSILTREFTGYLLKEVHFIKANLLIQSIWQAILEFEMQTNIRK